MQALAFRPGERVADVGAGSGYFTVRAALAPGGRVVVIDFIPKAPGERLWGPPPEQTMSREEVDVAMAAAGLKPVRVHDFLPEHFFVEYTIR